MFEGFEQVKDEKARKRWFASAGTSLVIYGVVGVVLIIIAKQTVAKATEEPEIDVTFQQQAETPEDKLKKEEPPPPPPPPSNKPKVKRPGRVAPVQPTVIPEGRPSEATPTGHVELPDDTEIFGDGPDVGGGGLAPQPPAPPPPPPPPPVEDHHDKDPAPVDELDTAFVKAAPLASNAAPTYPEDMRHKGVEATVRLKVKISDQGEVVDVAVLDGDEPFATAAVNAVKTWKYKPATDGGRAVASTRVVSIPFRLPAH